MSPHAWDCNIPIDRSRNGRPGLLSKPHKAFSFQYLLDPGWEWRAYRNWACECTQNCLELPNVKLCKWAGGEVPLKYFSGELSQLHMNRSNMRWDTDWSNRSRTQMWCHHGTKPAWASIHIEMKLRSFPRAFSSCKGLRFVVKSYLLFKILTTKSYFLTKYPSDSEKESETQTYPHHIINLRS